jgi:predicted DsbA family dithiol-disulfide isomerase
VTDDCVRMALANATEREGQHTNDWNLAAEIGAKAGGLDKVKLLERARSPEVEARARASTAEFHALKVTQRPTFVVDSEIGDRAIFSGFAKLEPIAATIDAMLDDLTSYASHAAHFGEPPPV